MNSGNLKNNQKRNLIHIILIAVTTIMTILVSLYSLYSGTFIVFQNLFYIPIILSCMYYTMRGFIYSVCLAVIYLLLILSFTSESAIIIHALLRVALFIAVAGVIAFLSMRRHQSEQEKSAILKGLKDIIVEFVDADMSLIWGNDALSEFTGKSVEELKGGKCYAFLHGRSEPCKGCSAKKAIESGMFQEGEAHTPDGRPLMTRSFPIIGEDGKTMNVVHIALDITGRKHSEQLLLNERKKFFTLSENAAFGIILIDGEGNIIYVNSKFRELFGYDIDDIPDGRTWFKKAYPDPEYRRTVISAWVEDLKQAKIGQKRPRIFKVYCKDGTEKIVNFVPVQLETGEHMMSCDDITKQKRFEEKLQTMSLTDELTGLYNRRGFITLSDQQLRIAERTKKNLLLFFADLDKMKYINDTLGHMEGDKALAEVATALKEVFRESDIIGRMGGDEFAILAIDVTEKTGEVLINRLHNVLDNYNKPEGRAYHLSLSIGIAHYDPEKPCSLDELIARADTLMYEEKRNKQQ